MTRSASTAVDIYDHRFETGLCTVTFALQGFATVVRSGIELAGAFIATVNGELRVGALEERSPSPGLPRSWTSARRRSSRSCHERTNDVLSVTTRYGAAWQNVSAVLPPRMIKLGLQIDF